MTVAEALRATAARLERAGCASSRVDAEYLVAHALGVTRTQLYGDGARRVSPTEEQRLDAVVRRREAREPLAYVLGEWGFRRLTLVVDRRVLVPRPETEVVVERCLERLRGLAQPKVLDVGVGSGAIALAIADEHPGAHVTAFDNSTDALAVARTNAEALGLLDRVHLVEHDLAHGLGPAEYDLVVSNPPYVEAEELETLEPEVRDWEPRSALVADGATEAIAAAARDALRDGGWVVFEVADGKAADIARRLDALGYRGVTTSHDLANRERVVEARWHASSAR